MTSTILDYINTSNTLGALQLNGPWGCGKTYYIRNILLPEINKREDQKNNDKKRHVLVASLFGISKTEDIALKLYFSLLEIKTGISNNRLKTIKDWSANMLKTIPGINKADWDKLLTLSPEYCLKALGRGTVVILDDLERLSDAIEIESVLGFINELIENYDFKVILISNQKELEKEKLSKYKEKVIYKTIFFDIDKMDIVLSMCEKFNSLLPSFIRQENVLCYLQAPENDIDLQEALSNLRTIRYAISQFLPFFDFYTKEVVNIDSLDYISFNKLTIIWRFIVALCIEYKRGAITYYSDYDLQKAIVLSYFKRKENKDISKNESQPYEVTFLNRYYNSYNTQFIFIEPIYNYIIKGILLKESDFCMIDELISKRLGVYKEPIDDNEAYILNVYENYFNFTDEEAPDKFNKFLSLISNGTAENLYEFVQAANFISEYKTIFNKEEGDIISAICKGVDTYFENIESLEILNRDIHRLEIADSDFVTSSEAKAVFTHINNKISQQRQLKHDKEVEYLTQLLQNDFLSFTEAFKPLLVQNRTKYDNRKPILHLLDASIVRKRIANLTPAEVYGLHDMLDFRYIATNGLYVRDELEFILLVKETVDATEDKSILSNLMKQKYLKSDITKILAYNK